MAIIKGQNLRMLFNDKIVACATSCTIHFAANIEDVSTKDNTDLWQVNETSSLTWDGQADALVAVTNDSKEGFMDLFDLLGKVVYIEFAQTNLPDNEKASLLKGIAIINDISLNAGNRQNASYSVKFTGTGIISQTGDIQDM